MRRDKQDRELHTPKDQMADHALRSDTHTFRNVVGDIKVRRPNRADDLCHGGRPGVGLNSVPEEGSDGTSDDGEAREVPAKGCTHGNGKRDVELGADHAVEDKRDSADQTAKDDAHHRLTPVMDASVP